VGDGLVCTSEEKGVGWRRRGEGGREEDGWEEAWPAWPGKVGRERGGRSGGKASPEPAFP